jgi:hypothetical protein
MSQILASAGGRYSSKRVVPGLDYAGRRRAACADDEKRDLTEGLYYRDD